MNDPNLTDYSYGVKVDIDHTSHNALSDLGTYLEITGITSPPIICLGPIYVNHVAKLKKLLSQPTQGTCWSNGLYKCYLSI